MRLLNVDNLSLRTFQPATLPKYAITSHRWEDDEASMQDIRNGLDLSKSGHRKVKGFADYVRDRVHGIHWIWIDTCCINQDSSQEVSEAINSMFKWYSNSEVCLAYLADVRNADSNEGLEKSIWFTRGWTLQELVAPSVVIFLSQDWNVIGRSGGDSDSYSNRGIELHAGPLLAGSISTITGVPEGVIIDYSQARDISVQDKLRWVIGRQTTKEEDLVYCLLGICGVSMPVIYGEGYEKAKKRLMQELEAEGHDLDRVHASSSRSCVSVPYGIVPTYTERTALSNELDQKLQQARVDRTQGRAISIVGDTGSGKTQLALRYIETHSQEYDTVLWFDASSRFAIRTSFERCCHELSLPIGNAVDDNEMKDVKDDPAVQTLLPWLRSRPPEKKWLAVFDGADNPALDAGSILPRGPAGTVVTIHCDVNAARTLVGNSSLTKVGAMSTSKGAELLERILDENDEQSDELYHLAGRVAISLGNMPRAIELVGARLRADADNDEDIVRLMGECLAHEAEPPDLSSQQCQGPAHECFSVSSLRLSRLLALFNHQVALDQIFRLAALRLVSTARSLSIAVPSWFGELLCLGNDGTWDSTYYHNALAPLLRYGLVKPTTDQWPGVKTHASIQWSFGREAVPEALWELFLLLIVSAIDSTIGHNTDVQFQRHLAAQLPSMTDMLRWSRCGQEGMAWACTLIGRLYIYECRFRESEIFLSQASKDYVRTLGKEHQTTLGAEYFLAQTYEQQEKWAEAEALRLKHVDVRTRMLGKEHPVTLLEKRTLMSIYRQQGRFDEAAEVGSQGLQAMRQLLGENHKDTIAFTCSLGATYAAQGRTQEALDLQIAAMEASKRVLGWDHRTTLNARFNYNELISWQGRWEEAEQSQEQIVEDTARSLGPDHPDTIVALEDLQRYRRGRISAAREAVVEQGTPSDPSAASLNKTQLGSRYSVPDEAQGAVDVAPYSSAALKDVAAVPASSDDITGDHQQVGKANTWVNWLNAMLYGTG